LGADFDRLAQALSGQYRIVAPDVVGRGGSDWLDDPMGYAVPQYVGDMVTLIARLNVDAVDWLGTSMGGLIGMGLAGMARSPIRRLVLNDVGPRLDFSALQRIAAYVGHDPVFANHDEAIAYLRSIFSGFGLNTEADWRALALPGLRADADGVRLHYDPRIALPMAGMTAEIARAAEAVMWRLYDAIQCPSLLIRGERSDLLSEQTAAEMTTRGPKATCVVVPGVGHAPTFFDAAQIDLVRQFLIDL
jgi:pimeloyl-ACP methyl ester carboxylesterase